MLNKKKIIIISTLAIALIGIGVHTFTKPKEEYKTRPVAVKDITQVVEASGTINPVNTVSVGSTVSGLISGLYADYNSQVKFVFHQAYSYQLD